jgi:hypothetical protein
MAIRIVRRDVQPGIYRIYDSEEDGAHWIAVSAQDLLDLMDWTLLAASELRQQARIADALARNQAMELAPNEIDPEQEAEDTRKYMEHHYLGGE